MEDRHDESWPNSEEQSSEWYDDEGCYFVCGVAGSNPNPKQQNNEKVKLMIDCGSQSTACCVNFPKNDATDDSERAKLWDIQDLKIEAHGKKIVDVMFHGQTNVKVVVSDVARNVNAESRIRFAMHESRSHTQRSARTAPRQRLHSTVSML